MPNVNLPLSGPVAEAFQLWASLFSLSGSQIGLINVNFGKSSDPAIEAEVLSVVASYGKQLGRIGEVVLVLLDHFHPAEPLKEAEEKAVDDLKRTLADIADVKKRHGEKRMLGR